LIGRYLNKLIKPDSHPMVFGIEGIMVSVRLEKKKEYTDCWRVELLVNRVTTGGQNNPKVNFKPGDCFAACCISKKKTGRMAYWK